ncbi:unnamed protein product, partial [Ectocarpus sp. 12 AP-2014]
MPWLQTNPLVCCRANCARLHRSALHPTLRLRHETPAKIANPSLCKSQGGHGRARHKIVVAALLLPKHLLPQHMRSRSVPESARIPGVGSHKVGVLLERTKISPRPDNASVREDLLKYYTHTKASSNH